MRKLSDLAKGIELSESLESLSDRVALRKHELSTYVAAEILTLFRWSVGSTVAITMVLVIIDALMVSFHVIKPEERLIGESILLALIGASVVQVGAASAAIAYGLFGQPATSPETPEGGAEVD